mgnify:CR=1 FL=1
MKDELIWVDLNDNVVGHGEKLETHKRNILHRAFSVFLYSNGKMLIQQREKNKYHIYVGPKNNYTSEKDWEWIYSTAGGADWLESVIKQHVDSEFVKPEDKVTRWNKSIWQ